MTSTSIDPHHEILFEQVRIGPKTMRNRFYQTPHADGLNSQYPGAEAGFRGMKAEGGWAVVNTGMTSIAPEYDHSGREVVSRIWDDLDVRNWAHLCDRIHEHGSLAGIELMASGGHVTGYETRLPAGAVSEVPDDWLFMGSSFEMDRDDIRQRPAEICRRSSPRQTRRFRHRERDGSGARRAPDDVSDEPL